MFTMIQILLQPCYFAFATFSLFDNLNVFLSTILGILEFLGAGMLSCCCWVGRGWEVGGRGLPGRGCTLPGDAIGACFLGAG